MNPDNPYAAPQTIAARAKLPLAQSALARPEREHFTALSTKELSRVESASRAIQRMTVLCGMLIAFVPTLAMVLAVTQVISLSEAFGLIALCLLLFLRMYTGVVRGQMLRWVSVVIDLSISLVAIYYLAQAMFIARSDPSAWTQFLRVSSLFFLIFLIMQPCLSILAHIRHKELFGEDRYLHEELSQELKYRRQQIT